MFWFCWYDRNTMTWEHCVSGNGMTLITGQRSTWIKSPHPSSNYKSEQEWNCELFRCSAVSGVTVFAWMSALQPTTKCHWCDWRTSEALRCFDLCFSITMFSQPADSEGEARVSPPWVNWSCLACRTDTHQASIFLGSSVNSLALMRTVV